MFVLRYLALTVVTLICAAGLGLAITTYAIGQTTNAPADQQPSTENGKASAESLTDTVTVPAWPKAVVDLVEDSKTVPASFALGQIEGIDPKLLQGVTANGFARKVAVEDQSVGQVLITTVAKGDKEEEIVQASRRSSTPRRPTNSSPRRSSRSKGPRRR